MKATILKADEHGIREAMRFLKEGKVTILPTENVYGFFVNGNFAQSIEQVYEIKKREKNKPFVVFVTKETAAGYGYIPEEALRIVADCWPAPVSIVVNKKPTVSDTITRGLGTVAMMCLGSRVIKAVCENVQGPICGTTVNYAGEEEIKISQAATERFGDVVDLIVEGDELLEYGKPSTIVDFTKEVPTIIRVGAFPVDVLKKYVPRLAEVSSQ